MTNHRVLHRHRRSHRDARRRRARGDAEPPRQPQLADRAMLDDHRRRAGARGRPTPRCGSSGSAARAAASVPARASAPTTTPTPAPTDPTDVLHAANRAVRAIVALPKPVVVGRAGPGRGRRRVAGDRRGRRPGLGEGVFPVGVHQDWADARRRGVGVGRRVDRPDQGDADGAAGRAPLRRRRAGRGPGQRGAPGRRPRRRGGRGARRR